MNQNKSDPILFHIRRDPLAFVFEKGEQVIVLPLPVETAQILAFELLEIPAVAGNFGQMAEALVIQKLQMQQQMATIN